jgi:GT2 family glycosyltransferase
VVFDNHSSDGSVAMVLSAFPGVEVMESETNLGYGAAANCRSTFDARKTALGIPPGHRWRYEIFDFQEQPKLSSGSRS